MNARLFVGLVFLCVSATRLEAETETGQSVSLRPRVTGTVEKVHVKAGAAVKTGDLLFELDSALLRAELAQANARATAAEALLQLHTAGFERANRLFLLKVLPREELDKAVADRATAQANMEVVRAQREIAKLYLDFTKIRAPIDGTIHGPFPGVGTLVKADETVLAVITQGALKPSTKLHELQKERHAVLVKAAAQMIVKYKTGRASASEIFETHRAAVEAALELADTPAERIEALRQNLKISESLLDISEARSRAGVGSETEALQALAAVLEVRIRLLREEEKVAAPK